MAEHYSESKMNGNAKPDPPWQFVTGVLLFVVLLVALIAACWYFIPHRLYPFG